MSHLKDFASHKLVSCVCQQRYFYVNDIIDTKAVLEKLGISMSVAISIFLKQIVEQDGLPFDFMAPFNKPISILDLKEDEFKLELVKAENDFVKNRIYSLKEVKKEILKIQTKIYKLTSYYIFLS